MDEFEATDVAVGAVGSEGERRSSTLSPARDDESIALLAPLGSGGAFRASATWCCG